MFEYEEYHQKLLSCLILQHEASLIRNRNVLGSIKHSIFVTNTLVLIQDRVPYIFPCQRCVNFCMSVPLLRVQRICLQKAYVILSYLRSFCRRFTKTDD